MTHSVFAIVAPVAPDRIRELQTWLDPHDRGTDTIRDLSLRDLDTVHFAGVVTFPPPAGKGVPAGLAGTLVLECCVDGPIDEFLDTLVHVGSGTLIELFGHCLDYRPGTATPEAYLRQYLASHVRTPHLHHVGSPRMPAQQIVSGAALRLALDRALDRIVALGRSHDGAREIVGRLRDRFRVPPSWQDHWHLEPESVEGERYAWYADPAFPWISRLGPWLRLAVAVSLPVLLLGWAVYAGHGRRVLIALALMLVAAWASWRWLTGRHPPSAVNPEALNQLTEREDRGVLNHMTSLAPLKPGLPRRLALHAVLATFNLFYRTIFTDITPGRLSGLPTIHFAQWTVVPCFDHKGHPTRHKALLFLSNYDGSWETYLDDFLAHLMQGVVAIWANTTGFPWPVDGPTFKQWARTRMTPWQVWSRHACYGDLTVQNIQNNERIRQGLLAMPASDHAARLWLSRFGALKTGVETFDDETFEETRRLEESDIQGLVLSAFAGLEEAAYVLLRMADTPEGKTASRHWLQHHVLPHVTSARERSVDERRAETVAINVAFTWRGLHGLGLDPSALGRFPLVFKEGMAPEDLTHRSRILGDTGDSDPQDWAWGSPGVPVDVLVMVFARPGGLDGFVDHLVKVFEESGAGTKAYEIRGHLMRAPGDESGVVEHFGFRDGLSDPVLEGSWRARRQPASMHLLKPGEFLLGYPSADGTIAPGIAIDARVDPRHVLPPAPRDPASRDFGRNGTYLVCRQLSQRVAEFRRALEDASGAPCDSAAAEALAARVVGRWRNGTPMHVPGADRGDASNEFGFAEDPHGFACPIGAHIRRANPRDSLGPDAGTALRSASRHRMLRRGRPYGPPLPAGQTSDDGRARGLVFLCLNGDIERQFEFVQQNWINNPAFSGLYDEADPLIGGSRDPRHLTVQAHSVRKRIDGLGRFVTVRGGQYFFLPGLSALRYLASPRAAAASGVPASDLLRQPVAAPAVRRPNRLHAALTVAEAILPWLRTAWAARVPLLLIAALLLMALAPRLSPSVAPTMFLVDRPRGIFAVALLASLAAFVAMITLRIVLLYGERLGLSRARWQGPARWAQVLAFQALAVPVVWEVMEQTARDRAAAGTAAFWTSAADLTPAALLGFVAGLACLWIATALQALKPGARPELFFPPNPLTRRLGLRGARIAPPRVMTRLVAATAQWIVDGVPPGIGAGYIDYRRRRLLSGHVFAVFLGLVVLALYVAGYFALHPEREGATWNLPPVAYLLFVLIAACWLLSGLTFFFDRYHIPTIAVLAVWLATVASLARTDHYFPVSGPVEPAPAPAVMMARAEALAPDAPVVVVAAEGLGLVSSAWTAEVLTRLTESLGERFTRSLRMISAASGASLGTVYFVHEYTDAGFGGAGPPDERARLLATVRARARTSSSAEGAWGLAYPDLVRQFAPVFVPRRMDRDWARESVWRRALDGGPEPTLSAWRRDVAAGWRPAVAFGVTVVESGERGLLATYQSPAPVRDVTASRDISMLTAARLSAAFPVISAAARPDTPEPAAFHLTDGGYWDNSGIVSAIEWLEAARPTRKDRVVFLEIRSSPPRVEHVPENASWLLGLTAPLRTLVGVRYEGQPYRNASALDTYRALWRQRHGTDLPHVVFDLKDDRLPLTWNLGHAAPARFTDAWRRSDVQAQVEVLRSLLDAAR